MENDDRQVLVFEGNLNGLLIRRELTFDAKTYLINEKIIYNAEEGKAFIARVGYTLAGTEYSSSSTYNPMQVVWNEDGSYDYDSDAGKLRDEGKVRFILQGSATTISLQLLRRKAKTACLKPAFKTMCGVLPMKNSL